jgi:hypothetical protein
MIRSSSAGLALTAVAAAGIVYLVGLVDPATEMVCRHGVGTAGATTPATSAADSTVTNSSASTESPAADAFTSPTGPAPPTMHSSPNGSTTTDTSESCLPADEMPEQEKP